MLAAKAMQQLPGGQQATANGYPTQQGSGCSLGPDNFGTGVILNVFNATIDVKGIIRDGSSPTGTKFTDEFALPPSGQVFPKWVGFAARSHVAGAPAQVVATLWTAEDGPLPASPVPISSILSPSGSVTPGIVVDWNDLSALGVFTFNSAADAPTFVVNTPSDLTTIIPLGARFKLNQLGATLYFIVTAVAAGTITLYGGTDYALTNNPISTPNFATTKAPLGFPLNPTKWTVLVQTSANDLQAGPVNGTWYNPNARQVSLPIGTWRLSWAALMQIDQGANQDSTMYTALSTANNASTDADLQAGIRNSYNDGGAFTRILAASETREKVIAVAAKTPYFLVIAWFSGGAAINTIALLGSAIVTTLRAESAYL